MPIRTFKASEAIPEQSDAEYTCTFHDAGPDAEAIVAASILTITATLSDVATGAIINNREDQDVLNANGGTLTSPGVFTLRLVGEVDNIIHTASPSSTEKHRLTLKVTYQRPGPEDGFLNHEVIFYVLRLTDVPTPEPS
jgi:hypothetical protein